MHANFLVSLYLQFFEFREIDKCISCDGFNAILIECQKTQALQSFECARIDCGELILLQEDCVKPRQASKCICRNVLDVIEAQIASRVEGSICVEWKNREEWNFNDIVVRCGVNINIHTKISSPAPQVARDDKVSERVTSPWTEWKCRMPAIFISTKKVIFIFTPFVVSCSTLHFIFSQALAVDAENILE